MGKKHEKTREKPKGLTLRAISIGTTVTTSRASGSRTSASGTNGSIWEGPEGAVMISAPLPLVPVADANEAMGRGLVLSRQQQREHGGIASQSENPNTKTQVVLVASPSARCLGCPQGGRRP